MATRILKPNRKIDGRPFYLLYSGCHTGSYGTRASRRLDKIMTNFRNKGFYVRKITTGRHNEWVHVFVSPKDRSKNTIRSPIIAVASATHNDRGRQTDDGLRIIWGEKVKLG